MNIQKSESIIFNSDAIDSFMNTYSFQKPDKSKQQEDYLLGKAIDKNYDQPANQESEIPAVARRVVGSSMLATAGDVQVDLARKLREDPLLLVKERERAARAALLNNPLHRRKLTELLRKEQVSVLNSTFTLTIFQYFFLVISINITTYNFHFVCRHRKRKASLRKKKRKTWIKC